MHHIIYQHSSHLFGYEQFLLPRTTYKEGETLIRDALHVPKGILALKADTLTVVGDITLRELTNFLKRSFLHHSQCDRKNVGNQEVFIQHFKHSLVQYPEYKPRVLRLHDLEVWIK